MNINIHCLWYSYSHGLVHNDALIRETKAKLRCYCILVLSSGAIFWANCRTAEKNCWERYRCCKYWQVRRSVSPHL